MTPRIFAVSLFAVSGLLAAGSNAAGTTNFNVSASGMSAYVIGGVNNPTLTLTRGQTYAFTLNTPGHPFWITTAPGAAEVGLNAYASGVTNNGASTGVVSFVVPASAPATLFYQCAFHDPMVGTLNVINAAVTAAPAPAMGTGVAAALAALLMLVALAFVSKRARA